MSSNSGSNVGRPQQRIHIGMTFDEVCASLGPPDGVNPGSEILGGAGEQAFFTTYPGSITETRSKLFFTRFCVWRRPEGMYSLVFEHDKLARVSGAPDGTIAEQSPAKDNRLPARFVWVVTNGGEESPQDVFNTMLRERTLKISPDALIYGDINAEIAVDVPIEDIVVRATVRALRALDEMQKSRKFLDLESMRVERFRKARSPGSAGVIVTVAGPSNDPDSVRSVEVIKTGQRDICGTCGITEKERLRQWNAPAPPGMVKIGDGRGAFMYCPHCKEGVCGRCSIDLGLTAGCPKCRGELLYMDGGRQ
jgi:hypothetical protein